MREKLAVIGLLVFAICGCLGLYMSAVVGLIMILAAVEGSNEEK